MKSVKPMLTLAFAAAGAATAFVPAAAQAETPVAQMHISTPDGEYTIQATCGAHKSPDLYDIFGNITASARWSVICRNGYVYMDGYVDDRRSDGKCAEVRGEIPGSPNQYARNCPADSPRTNFTFKGNGTQADGYLYLV